MGAIRPIRDRADGQGGSDTLIGIESVRGTDFADSITGSDVSLYADPEEAIFNYVGWPAYFKPHSGGGWKNVSVVRNASTPR